MQETGPEGRTKLFKAKFKAPWANSASPEGLFSSIFEFRPTKPTKTVLWYVNAACSIFVPSGNGSGGLPLEEAIEFLRDRVMIDDREWAVLFGSDVETLLRGMIGPSLPAMRQELRAAVGVVLAAGGTLRDFSKIYHQIVARYGWSAKGRDLGRHAELIFRTEISNAYAAGRWMQIQRVKKLRPYLRYACVDPQLTQKLWRNHAALHNVVLPVEHPFWCTHYPPNSFYCRCSAQSFSERDLKRHGCKVTEDDDPALLISPDAGFSGNVGIAWERWRNSR